MTVTPPFGRKAAHPPAALAGGNLRWPHAAARRQDRAIRIRLFDKCIGKTCLARFTDDKKCLGGLADLLQVL